MLEHFTFKDSNTHTHTHTHTHIIRANISYYLLFPFSLFYSFFLNCPLYQEHSFVITKGHSSRGEQSLAMLQGIIQPNYLLLGKDTFHTHTGTLSSKTNLFPHSQAYSCLSSVPVSTWDDRNHSEHDKILYPKVIYQTLFSLLHACKVSAFLCFHFLLPKVKTIKKLCKYFSQSFTAQNI